MFSLTDTAIDVTAQARALQHPAAGGFVTFEGRVRNHNHGRDVMGLEYTAYEQMAVAAGERVLQEARKRFDILSATCVHRVGVLNIGESAVWVGVAAAHRKDAFAACEWIVDEVKSHVPIWKCESYSDGTQEWVAPCCGHQAQTTPA